MNTEPVLVYSDEPAIEAFQSAVAVTGATLQRVLDEYAALKIGALEPGDLPALLGDPSTFVHDRLLARIPEQKNIGGFAVKKEAVLSTMDVPSTARLEEAVKTLQLFLSRTPLLNIYTHLTITDGKVELNVPAIRTTAQVYNVWATSENEVDAALELNAYISAFKRFDKWLKARNLYGGLLNVTRNQLFTIDENSEPKLNLNFYHSIK